MEKHRSFTILKSLKRVKSFQGFLLCEVLLALDWLHVTPAGYGFALLPWDQLGATKSVRLRC